MNISAFQRGVKYKKNWVTCNIETTIQLETYAEILILFFEQLFFNTKQIGLLN